jgi:hypothetical protein
MAMLGRLEPAIQREVLSYAFATRLGAGMMTFTANAGIAIHPFPILVLSAVPIP